MLETKDSAHIVRVECSQSQGQSQKFAVYAGEGVYLRSLARDGGGRHSFGRDRARSYTRAGAVAALHAVRRMGRAAWIVPHPGALA